MALVLKLHGIYLRAFGLKTDREKLLELARKIEARAKQQRDLGRPHAALIIESLLMNTEFEDGVPDE